LERSLDVSRTVLVLDGHDGAGKTTLAARLAEAVGGVHIRPFAGPAGNRMLQAAERGDIVSAEALARTMVDRALANCDARVVVCDRHWMTLFTLLPQDRWSLWQPVPPTVLCWADLKTTLARLAERSDEDQPTAYHRRYLRRYCRLGEAFGCYVLRTDQDTVDGCVQRLVAWSREYIDIITG
jgi:thymidylate kinase